MVSSFSADNSVSDADILRFFAGCDVLSADNIKLSNLKEKKKDIPCA